MAKKTYAEKLLDPRWQQMRLRVFERDNWTCQGCHLTESTLHVHHPVYHPMIENPWDYHPDSLFTLCKECHETEHQDLKSSQAKVLLALSKIGYWESFRLETLSEFLEILSFDDFEKLASEKINAN